MLLGDEALHNRLQADGFYKCCPLEISEVVEMVFEQETPDGRTLVIALLEQFGSWRAKFQDEHIVRQSDTAAEAIAAVAGEPIETAWVAALARRT
jgi:hypothetical protein